MYSRSQLQFHETFQPEPVYLAKLLALASENYVGNKYEISEKTGIPTGKQKGKVEPHIKFSAYMGLINYTCEKGVYSLSLPPIGDEIYSQDPFLHEQLSKWLCHYNIVRREKGAPQWSFWANTVHQGFIQSISSERVMEQFRKQFDGNLSYEEIFGVMRRSYLEGFFKELEYLSINETNKSLSFHENSARDELLYAYAYAMMDSWEYILPEKKEITLFELLEDLSFGKIFGLADDTVNELLDDMSGEGIISVNRQLFPTTIIKTTSSNELIAKLYSRLL